MPSLSVQSHTEEQRRQRLSEIQEALANLDADRAIDGDAVLEWIDSWDTPRNVNLRADALVVYV